MHHLECTLEFFDVGGDVFRVMFLLLENLHFGGEVCFFGFDGSPIGGDFLGGLGSGEERVGLFDPEGVCSTKA